MMAELLAILSELLVLLLEFSATTSYYEERKILIQLLYLLKLFTTTFRSQNTEKQMGQFELIYSDC